MESSSASDINIDVAQSQYMCTYLPRAPTPAAPLTNSGSSILPPAPAHFQIPPLQSSFPPLLQPHYELVKQHCEGWILDVAQPPTAAACCLLLECSLPRLICRAIPSAASLTRLIHVAKIVSWFIIADDDDDHPDALGADDATIAQNAGRVMAIIGCDGNDDEPEPLQLGLHEVFQPNQLESYNPSVLMIDSRVPQYVSCTKRERKERALDALSKVWAEMQREMTPGLRNRFVLTTKNYFEAIKSQARFRRLHRIPSTEAYLEIRRQASFILPSFSLLEYALGIELEEDTYNHPLVEKFRNSALDYICLVNDLISCKVEIGVGDYFNMPSIVYGASANKERSFQDAIDHVASMIKDLDAQCVSMLSMIQQSSSFPLQHNFVNTYIVALCSCMSGCLAWYLETARYHDSSSSSLLEK